MLQSKDSMHYFSVMKNRLDAKVKRGASVKAVALGSRCKYVLEPFTKYLSLLLDMIFEC
jgi:hypothetical protein